MEKRKAPYINKLRESDLVNIYSNISTTESVFFVCLFVVVFLITQQPLADRLVSPYMFELMRRYCRSYILIFSENKKIRAQEEQTKSNHVLPFLDFVHAQCVLCYSLTPTLAYPCSNR